MDDMRLFLGNQCRAARLAQQTSQEIFTIKVVDDWGGGYWWHVGDTHRVKPYPFRTGKGGVSDYCSCPECIAEREGVELYETYETVEGGYDHNRGAVIPSVVCEVVNE